MLVKVVQTAPQQTVGSSTLRDEHIIYLEILLSQSTNKFFLTYKSFCVKYTFQRPVHLVLVDIIPHRDLYSVFPHTTFNSCRICFIFSYFEFALISSMSFIMQIMSYVTYSMLYSCRRQDYSRYTIFSLRIIMDLPTMTSILDAFVKF